MLTINTNIPSMIIRKNLLSATNALNQAIERMTTGYKINSAKDDAAGSAQAIKLITQMSSYDIASSNTQLGSNVLSTVEDTYDLINGHLQRIRDLTEQAATGVYATDSKEAIIAEINSRVSEIDRLSAVTDFNGIKLIDGTTTSMNIQVGIGSSEDNYIKLDESVFGNEASTAVNLINENWTSENAGQYAVDHASAALGEIDLAKKEVTSRITSIGAYSNRLDSASDLLEILNTNLSSTLSTVRDADVSKESSNYIKAQILQEASATLLTTANQAPSIAIKLI